MGKMWAGRFSKELDGTADDFNSSISFDQRMFRQDIRGSIAHATMLGSKGIISATDSAAITAELGAILEELESGKLEIDQSCEDIHMFVEQVLTERRGEVGKRLHTARSRNDQVATDLRLWVRDECEKVQQGIREVLEALVYQAERNTGSIMPGYTHLQRAQPVTFGHYLMAYAMMLIRDAGRLTDAAKRMNVCPLGSCALAGTTFDLDRAMTAEKLGFDSFCLNSLDGVSDRDFCVEITSALATLMMHLSRMSEEIILWASWEFKFIELDDSYTTGSSIMPQKKNPDMAELIRGKTGRVYGDLMALLTALKGLPLAYNKDMQEDKEAIFDAFDTAEMCLKVLAPMVKTMRSLPDNMKAAAQRGFINATDLADYLVKQGMPFRAAYKVVGQMVGQCISEHKVLEDLTIEEFKQHSDLFEQDVYEAISLETCVNKRISEGGPTEASVKKQIAYVTEFLK